MSSTNLHTLPDHGAVPHTRRKSPVTSVTDVPPPSGHSRDQPTILKKFRPQDSISLDDVDEIKRGPGAYELPPIFGKKRMVSNVGNTPAYSIGSSARMLSGDGPPKTGALGAPGVGRYSPKFVLPKSPGFVPTKAARFARSDDKEKRLPVMYAPDICRRPKRYGGEFLRASRFALRKPIRPGPGDYDVNSYLTLEEKLRKARRHEHSNSGLGEDGKRLREESLSPGPGDYEIYKSTLVRHGAKFDSAARFATIEPGKGPGDYSTEQIALLSRKVNPVKVSFYQARRGLNYKQVEASNSWFSKFGPA